MAMGRLGGWAVRVGVLVAVFLTAQPPNRLTAQDSQFGIRGLGTPGRWESVRARATGGAFAPFDPFSPLLEASFADVRRGPVGRTRPAPWAAGAIGRTGPPLRAPRFPRAALAGPGFPADR